MPQPMTGDSITPHVGTHYWGGAMFCLLADVEIRKQSHQRSGTGSAARRGARQRGLAADWPIERILHTGDGAVGTHDARGSVWQMKTRPSRPIS